MLLFGKLILYDEKYSFNTLSNIQAGIARILNDFENDPFYTHLVSLFMQ